MNGCSMRWNGSYCRSGHLQGLMVLPLVVVAGLFLSVITASADPWKQAAELANAGQFQKASEAFSKLIKQQPDDVRGYMGRGRALWRMGRLDAAIADFDKAVALDPKNAEAYNSRALAHHKKGREDRALPDHDRAIELSPEKEVHWFNRGLTLMAMKEWDNALADFSKAIELDPKQGDTYRVRANVFTNRSEYDKAIADCDKAIELNEKDAEACYYRANAHAKMGEHQKALADFDRAIELNPQMAVFHNNRGTLLRNRGENDEALASFEMAIKLDPTNALYVSNRGLAWLNKGRMEKALADFDKGIQLNPGDGTAYRKRAGGWLAVGEFEKAISDATKAIELTPTEGEAFRIRGAAREATGNNGKEDMERAMILGPRPPLGVAVASVSPEILSRERAALKSLLVEDTPENRVRLATARHDHASAILEQPQLGPEALTEAMAYARSAAVLEPENSEHETLTEEMNKESAFRHFTRAMEMMEEWERGQGDKDTLNEALGGAEKATQQDPSAAPYFHLLGYICTKVQDDPRAASLAEDALQKALTIRPGNLPTRLLLARLLMNRGAYAPALDSLEECVGKDSLLLDSPLADDMCRAYVAVSQAPRGEKFFQNVLKVRAGSGPARLAMANLIHAQGRADEAQRELTILTTDGRAAKEDVEFAKKLSQSWQEKK